MFSRPFNQRLDGSWNLQDVRPVEAVSSRMEDVGLLVYETLFYGYGR
jgi:hypothetical protein